MTGINIACVASVGWLFATASASPELSMMRLAADAPAYGILAWTLFKTIPQISTSHKEGLEAVANEVKENGQRTNKLLERALELESCDTEGKI